MRTQRKIINLYDDKNIFSIKHVISISNEEDLNQFWDYITCTQDSEHEVLNTFVSSFYNFALSYMDSDDAHFFEIILEENEDNFYFTLWNESISNLFEKYLSTTPTQFIYDGSRISIKLVKKDYDKKRQKQNLDDEIREQKLIKSVSQEQTIKCIEPYTFISADDLDELLSLNDDMQDIAYQIKTHGINEHQFIKLRSTFSLFSFTLRYYDEVSKIATTVNNFLNLLNTSKDNFLALDSIELELIYGFTGNLDRWLNTLFVRGGADLHFMDNSIQADYETILQIISPSVEEDFDLDDIFDF